MSNVVDREARLKSTDKWMSFGNVTLVEAAKRLCIWTYNWNSGKRLPQEFTVFVREKGSETEHRVEVTLRMTVDANPVRGDDV